MFYDPRVEHERHPDFGVPETLWAAILAGEDYDPGGMCLDLYATYVDRSARRSPSVVAYATMTKNFTHI